MCQSCCLGGGSAGRRRQFDRRPIGSASHIGIERVRRWAIGTLVLVGVDRRREEEALGTEEVVHHTEEVEAGAEAQVRGEVGVEEEATEIGTMIGRPSGRVAIHAADRHLRGEGVEARGGVPDTTVGAGVLAVPRHQREEEVEVLQSEAVEGGEASLATAAGAGPLAGTEVAEGGDETQVCIQDTKNVKRLRTALQYSGCSGGEGQRDTWLIAEVPESSPQIVYGHTDVGDRAGDDGSNRFCNAMPCNALHSLILVNRARISNF